MAKLYSGYLTSSTEVHGITRVGKQNRVWYQVFNILLEMTNLANLVTWSKVYVNILDRLSKGSRKQVQICVYFPDFRNRSYHDTAKYACLLFHGFINPTATNDAWAKPSLPSLRQPCSGALLCASCLGAAFHYLMPRWCSCISQHCKSCCFWFRYKYAFLISTLRCLALQTNTCRLLQFPPPALPCPYHRGSVWNHFTCLSSFLLSAKIKIECLWENSWQELKDCRPTHSTCHRSSVLSFNKLRGW